MESELSVFLEEEQRRRVSMKQEHLAQRIRKQFRNVARLLPGYDFFDVKVTSKSGRGSAGGESGGAPLGNDLSGRTVGEAATHAQGSSAAASQTGPPPGEPLQPAQPADSAPDTPEPADDPNLLFPPGPLACVEVKPLRLRMRPLATRSLRARGLDQDKRPCAGRVDVSWSLQGPGELESDGGQARYTAPDVDQALGRPPVLRVVAIQGDVTATADVKIQIQDGGAAGRSSGIPEPRSVSAPGQSWRSRLLDGRWEFNIAHRDYLEASQTEARRLRYLVNLLAKEVVLRNFGGPGDADVLERMVEVLTYLDRA